MVIDVERLGDYTKNILDMAIYYPEALVSEELLPELNTLENEVLSRFKKHVSPLETRYCFSRTFVKDPPRIFSNRFR